MNDEKLEEIADALKKISMVVEKVDTIEFINGQVLEHLKSIESKLSEINNKIK